MESNWLAVLGTIAEVAVTGGAPREVIQQALAELLPRLGFAAGAVYLWEDKLRLFAQHGFSEPLAKDVDPHLHPALGQALSQRKLVVDKDSGHLLPENPELVVVPLFVGERPLGVLVIKAQRVPGPSKLAWLESAAGMLALALVSSRKQAEAEESLQSFRQLIENELVGFYVLQDGKIVFANSALCRMSGYTREELLSRSYLDFIHPEDQALVKENLERRLRGEEALKRYRFRALRKDGSLLVLEVQAWPIVFQGRPAVQGILHDVTWEVEAERLRKSLLSAAREILGAATVEDVLRRAAQAVVEHSPFRRAVVCLYDLRYEPPLGGPVTAWAAAGLTPAEEEQLRAQGGLVPELRRLAFQEKFRVGRSYYIPHDQVPWAPSYGLPGKRASDGWHPDDFLFIPLRGRLGIIGHISVDEPMTPKAPTLDMLEPLELFAEFAALAAERAFELDELRRHKEWLRGAFHLAHKFGQCISVEDLLHSTLDVLAQEVNYEFGAVLLVEGKELVVQAAHSSLPGPRYALGQRIPLEQGVVGWVATHRQPLRLEEVGEDPRYIPVHPAIRAELTVPILFGEKLLGVLDVESVEPGRFRAQDEEFLLAVAELLGMALVGLRAREDLKELSLRDPLTNLYNRRYLLEVLSHERQRARRYGAPFSLVILDLDNFREVNNRFGHARGDEVLRGVAELLLRNLRSCDFVFRYGGDEFFLVLPETDYAGAEEAVARVRQKLRAWSHSLDLGLTLDFSAGIAAYDPGRPRPLEELLSEADARLYAQKRVRAS